MTRSVFQSIHTTPVQAQPSKYPQYPLEHLACSGGGSGSCFPCGTNTCLAASCCSPGHSCHPLPSQVTAKESLCNKCPSITCPTAVFTSSPVPHLFSASHLATFLLSPTSSVGSEQNPHWQPEAGQPQIAANSLLLFLCQLSSWHQCGEDNCCVSGPTAQTNNRDQLQSFPIWAVHLPLALPPTGH